MRNEVIIMNDESIFATFDLCQNLINDRIGVSAEDSDRNCADRHEEKEILKSKKGAVI